MCVPHPTQHTSPAAATSRGALLGLHSTDTYATTPTPVLPLKLGRWAGTLQSKDWCCAALCRAVCRYLRHFRGIFSSRTLQGLAPAIAFFTGMAALAGKKHAGLRD